MIAEKRKFNTESVRKISRTAGILPATVERYTYDGHQIVADVDSSDNLLSMTTYTNGGAQASVTYYAIKDHQNTVIALTDSTGTVVESYEYDAYGRILDVKDASGNSIANQQSAIGNRYTFQGREIDWATGLYYFRARWYDPVAGRFISKDPIRISGGLNLYAFVSNNPVNFIDPSGLCKKLQTTAFGITLSGIAFGGPVMGFGIAHNDDRTFQLYLYLGGGNGFDISAGAEMTRGDNAMLTGTSYSGSAGYAGGFGQYNRDGNGNSSASGGYSVGTSSGAAGSGTVTEGFATPPISTDGPSGNDASSYNGVPGYMYFPKGL